VSATGASTLRLQPDRVSFSVGVQTDAPSVADAFKMNSAKVQAVVAALKAKGVRAEELQTSNFEITSRDDEGRPSSEFRVANWVVVTRKDPESVGELLQAAVGAGANQAGGLRFFVAEPAKVRGGGWSLRSGMPGQGDNLGGTRGRALGDVVCVSDTAFARVVSATRSSRCLPSRQSLRSVSKRLASVCSLCLNLSSAVV